ncbi:MAG: SDR family NAD(P)-dependent oxidoreductase [Flavobacteriales bacterium]|nr:SDR family NAD(P)-dependent oxidoreductase [Flavobacteriales bacterium]
MKKVKNVLITGATAGIGQATAELFASHGHALILTGRRAERLEETAKKISEEYGTLVLTLNFDIRDLEACKAAIDSIPDTSLPIDILVNNAGLAAGKDPLQKGSIDDWERMIDTNIKGLLYMTRIIAPQMVEAGAGHIINIGSTAGKEVYASGNVYCATKHAVDALTKGLRIDLLGTGVKVTQIAPGAAETEFSLVRYHGDEKKAEQVYEGYTPMRGEDIAQLIHMVTELPTHLCVNDLVVTSIDQANSFYISRELD